MFEDIRSSELYALTYSCPLNWNDMAGDDLQRHCDKCKLNVVDISVAGEKRTDEIFELARRGEEVCVRFKTISSKPNDIRSTTKGQSIPRFAWQKLDKSIRIVAAVVSLLVSLFDGLLNRPANVISCVAFGAAATHVPRKSDEDNDIHSGLR
jgi:hypothetical protein